MPFELVRQKHLDDDLRKIVRRELGNTARALTSGGSDLRDVIHDSRKSLKKVRAVATVLDQAGARVRRKDRKRLKSAASALSGLRDSAAIIESLDRVRRRYPKQLSERTYGALRGSLVNARNRQEAQGRRDGVIDEAAGRLKKTRDSAKAWTTRSLKMSDLVGVISSSYRRSRQAMTRARATQRSATLHRWRKELKTLWYQLRLAKPLLTGVAPLIEDLKRLETVLGDDHNLVVLCATLRACPELRAMDAEVRQIERLARRLRQSLRRRAFTLGRRIYVRTPQQFERWIRQSSVKRPPAQRAVA